VLVRSRSLFAASILIVLAAAAPAEAQGKSGSAPGKTKKGTPPSSSSLPAPAPTTGSSPISTATGASPLSWVDDASLLTPGSALLTVSVMHWAGAGVSELDVPVVDAAFGLTNRVQISATVPRVVGSDDGTGAVGGLGTSYFSGKIALLNDPAVKVAVSPLLEILGTGAKQTLTVGESRYQVGIPISIEIARGTTRIFGASGFFSRGAWFAGGGAGFELTPRTGASLAFTRSWATSDLDGLDRNRSELSGGVSYFVKPQIAVYGSVGRTIATTDINGAGTTFSTGVTFLLIDGVTKGVTK
jgi:hypothetical protein